MTNEERENAIRCLKLWIEREPQIQTYKTCLEALEQEPFINKPCISEEVCREDKIQVLEKIRAEIEDYVCNHETNTDKAQGMLNALQIIDKYR